MKHSLDSSLLMRLQFLVRVVRKESQHLASTDQRLFHAPFDIEQVKQLETNLELSERVEAFVSRFGRLQDTIGDKLLPTLLILLGVISVVFAGMLELTPFVLLLITLV